jgi:hypothetical protein
VGTSSFLAHIFVRIEIKDLTLVSPPQQRQNQILGDGDGIFSDRISMSVMMSEPSISTQVY